MLGTLATGCQTDSKDSNSLDKVESQVEQDVGGDEEVEKVEDVEESDIQNIWIKLNEPYNFFESVSKKSITTKIENSENQSLWAKLNEPYNFFKSVSRKLIKTC